MPAYFPNPLSISDGWPRLRSDLPTCRPSEGQSTRQSMVALTRMSLGAKAGANGLAVFLTVVFAPFLYYYSLWLHSHCCRLE